MQSVNLLPAYARPAGRWATLGKDLSPQRVIRLGGIAAAACAIAVAGFYVVERSVVNDRKATLADTQARLAAVEATAAPLRAAEASSTARATVIRTVDGTRVNWERTLTDFARVLPDQMSLQSLAVTSTAGATTGAAGTFTIGGTTTSHVRVALILDRLALLPWLSDISLGSSAHSGTSDQFSISAGFAPTGGAR
jgi:Tfp pilus assembly protein PilN